MKRNTNFRMNILFLGLFVAVPFFIQFSAYGDVPDSRQENSSAKNDLNQVIHGYLSAIGGEKKIRTINSKTMRYRVFMVKGGGYTMEQFIKRPGQLRQRRPRADQYFEFDGQKVWRVLGENRQEIKGPIVNSFKKNADLDGPFIDSAKKGISLEHVGKKRFEFSQLHQVEVTFKDGEKRQYYFDNETRLPVIMKKPSFLMINNKIKPGPTSIYYFFDYREVNGIKFPHLWVQTDQDQNHLHVFLVEKIILK